ncbi:hypothetical protein [Staphylococcus coagulans]|uniref:hypothetical protein n=2 Tax=Staphylococcus coagulans TaxID=74706 RepID=UPI003364E594
MNSSLSSKATCILKTKQKENGEKHMKNSVLLKSLIAVTVMTTATGSALFVGNGITHEAKAQQDNPNVGHFHKEVDGKNLNFEDVLSKDNLTPKLLAEEIATKLKENGLTSENYKFELKIVKTDGSIINGNGNVSGSDLSKQESAFNPTKDRIEVFTITKK